MSVCLEMKTFFIFISLAVCGFRFSSGEGRVPRQIWPGPHNHEFWPGNFPDNGYDMYDDSNPWMGPPRFDRPSGTQNDFRREGFGFGDDNGGGNRGGGRGNGGGGGGGGRGNGGGGGRGNNGGGGGGSNQNQNRRTTEAPGPITSTPRTLHYAPQGCNCAITQQFNPVCGTDGNTYKNMGLLNCYRRCGTNVSQRRLGTC